MQSTHAVHLRLEGSSPVRALLSPRYPTWRGQAHNSTTSKAGAHHGRCQVQTHAYAAAQPSVGAYYGSDETHQTKTIASCYSGPVLQSQHAQLVVRFFNHLNRRELGGMFSLLAQDVVYENSALQRFLRGKQAVVQFYIGVLRAVPDGTVFVLDGVTVSEVPEPPPVPPSGMGWGSPLRHAPMSGGAVRRVAVTWHLELPQGGLELPGSRGLALYTVDVMRGVMSEMRDAPQAVVRLLLPALALAAPAINMSAPLVLPLLREAGAAARDPGGLLQGVGYATSGATAALAATVAGVAAAAAQQAEAMEGVLFQGTPGTPEVSGPGTGLGSGAGSFVGPFAALVPAPLTHGVSGALHGVAAWASAFQADGLSSFLSRVEASGVGAHTAVDDAPEQPAYNIPMRRLSTPSSALSGPAARPARASPPHAASSPSPSPSPSLDTVPTPKSSVRVRGRPITGAPSSEPVIQSAAPSRHDEQHMSGDQQGRGYSNGVVGQDHSRRSVSPPSHTSPASLSGQSPAPAHVSHYAQPASHSAQLSARDHALARSPSLRAPAPTNLDYLPSRRSPGAPGAHHGPRSRSSVARAGSSDGSSASGSSEWGSSQEEGSMVGGDLSGVWEKDAQASDAESYEAMMDLLGLSGLQRVTARLIEGLEVVQSEEGLRVTFLTVVPFFKVTEASQFGAEVQLRRRDLRRGKQRARAERVPGGVRVTFTWGDPRAGQLEEQYLLTGPDEMAVRSRMTIGGQSVHTVQVYRRSGKDRATLLRESRSRNNSLEDVLARQKAQFGDT